MPISKTAFVTGLFAAAFIAAAGLALPAFADSGAEAVLKNADGVKLGEVELDETPDGVLLDLDLEGFPPGEHAFHIHEVGKCEPPFTSAGGHYNPGSDEHGYMSEHGPHAGDMPNIHVPQSGDLEIEIMNTMVTLNGENPLFDEDGSAIVIHEGTDDYKSQPSGDAGGRLACGVIVKD